MRARKHTHTLAHTYTRIYIHTHTRTQGACVHTHTHMHTHKSTYCKSTNIRCIFNFGNFRPGHVLPKKLLRPKFCFARFSVTVYTGSSSTGRKFDAAEMGYSPGKAKMCRLTVQMYPRTHTHTHTHTHACFSITSTHPAPPHMTQM